MKRSIISGLSVVLALLMLSCGNITQKNNPATKNITLSAGMTDIVMIAPTIAHTDTVLVIQIQHIYDDYLQMQSALAADQFKETAIVVNHLNTIINGFENNTLPEDQKRLYESDIAAIKSSADGIIHSKNIEEQRIAFESLSAGVFTLLKSFGSNKPVYETRCPMAFDNKGASWISDQTAIRNPYFGNTMLECGEVVSMIKK